MLAAVPFDDWLTFTEELRSPPQVEIFDWKAYEEYRDLFLESLSCLTPTNVYIYIIIYIECIQRGLW